MTLLQEREHLTAFLDKLTQEQAWRKVAELDALIQEAFTGRPEVVHTHLQRTLDIDCFGGRLPLPNTQVYISAKLRFVRSQ